MHSSSQPADSSPVSSSFAGFLSALASPAPSSRNASWNDDALADDVATLSYESALKAHSRYKPAPEPVQTTRPAAPTQHFTSSEEPQRQAAAPELRLPASGAGDPKSASITIRISQAECTQLRQRAAEAGMTISAYLRSCTFEAENLRGQVKEALSQMRTAASETKQPAATADPRREADWLSKIFKKHSKAQVSPRLS